MKLEEFGIIEEDAYIPNTYKIKAQAKYILHPYNKDSLLAFLKFQQKFNIPYLIIGGGSNIILADGKYPGVILILDQLNKIDYQNELVYVDAGVRLPNLALEIISHGLKGLEWAVGIPAQIGGAIVGNAEAYKISTFHYLETVTFITKDLEIKTLKKDEIYHDYRTSYFKENPGNIILSASFKFPKGNKEESLSLINDRQERRMLTQPLSYPSAGSVFRNPSVDNPSGKIIEELGLKGFSIGGAKISEKHANFIINYNHATGKDIRNLIQLIKEKVKRERNIDLVLEQVYIDW